MYLKKILYIILFLQLTLPAQAQVGWRWGAGSSGGTTEGWRVAADRFGNVYGAGFVEAGSADTIGGTIINDTSIRYDMPFIVKVGPYGSYDWVLPIDSSAAAVGGIVTDNAGNLFALVVYDWPALHIGGVTLTKATHDFTYALVKIDPSGTVLWAKNIALQTPLDSSVGLPVSPDCWGEIRSDNTGYIYVCAMFGADSITIGSTIVHGISSPYYNLSTLFVAKFDSSGNPVWANSIIDSTYMALEDFTVSGRGTVYICGDYVDTLASGGKTLIQTPGYYWPHFIVKMNSSGHTVWAHEYSAPFMTRLSAITADNNDHAYITGVFSNNTTFGPATFTPPVSGYCLLLACIDSSSAIRWARAGYGLSTVNLIPYSISIDQCGKVCATAGGCYFVFGSDTLHTPANMDDPALFVIYDSAGHYLMSTALPSGGDDLLDISVDNRGNLYLCGDNDVAMVVGADTLASAPGENFFIAKYRYVSDLSDVYQCPPDEVHTVAAHAAEVSLYPNPAYGECAIRCLPAPGAGATAELYDIAGRRIAAYPLQGIVITISLRGIPPGMYLCRISPGDGKKAVVKKLVVE